MIIRCQRINGGNSPRFVGNPIKPVGPVKRHSVVHGFALRDCASFAKEVTGRHVGASSLALQWVLACAVEEGWIEASPTLQTRNEIYKRVRLLRATRLGNTTSPRGLCTGGAFRAKANRNKFTAKRST